MNYCPECRDRRQIERDLTAKGPLDREIIGTADMRKQRSTADMQKPPFRYICHLEYVFPHYGRTSVGSGFLVGKSTLLTAGHVVAGKRPARLSVVPGRRGGLRPFGQTTATSFKFPQHYRQCGGDNPIDHLDYAIVDLEDPIGERSGYWTFDYETHSYDVVGTSIFKGKSLPQPIGTLKVNVSGYPLDKPNGMGCRGSGLRCDPTQPFAPGRDPLCGTYQYSSYDETIRMLGSGKVLVIANDLCPGHSGSPVWITRHPSMGGRVCIGMWVCGAKAGNSCVFMHDELRAFIRSHTK